MVTKNKKGVAGMEQLGALGIGIASLAITLVVVFLIISQGQTQIADIESFDATNTSQRTTSYNATVTLANAIDDIPAWVPLIVIAVIGSILIGLVAMFKRR